MPRSTSSGFRTVVWSTLVRMTGSRDAATRPAKPVPSGMRTPCLTSSSMPLAAVAISCRADWSSSSTAAVSARSTSFTRSTRASQQRILVEPGQRGIRQRFDVAQPVSGQPPGIGVPGKGDSHGYKLRPRTVPNNYSAHGVT